MVLIDLDADKKTDKKMAIKNIGPSAYDLLRAAVRCPYDSIMNGCIIIRLDLIRIYFSGFALHGVLNLARGRRAYWCACNAQSWLESCVCCPRSNNSGQSWLESCVCCPRSNNSGNICLMPCFYLK